MGEPPTVPDPAAQGEAWRAQMTPDRECLVALIWKRTFRVHGIDLADGRQATALQVYRLLAPLLREGEQLDVDALDLIACVDARVPVVFRTGDAGAR